ncbi:DsbA family protein [Cupriavidus basilensis]
MPPQDQNPNQNPDPDPKESPAMMKCDPVTGACLLPGQDMPASPAPRADRAGWAVRYIGDPMCSWCWGISPAVGAVANFCAAEGIAFTVTVGGLRAGGGDPWNDSFKAFLRNEWRHIAEVTGQPFGFTLLDAPQFDYDTEPACRAVVAVQLLLAGSQTGAATALAFFSAVQRRFYVDGDDPKTTDFYRDICAGTGVDFAAFRDVFESAGAKQAVQEAFARCRRWGVRSFPTLLLAHDRGSTPLAVGYATAEQMLGRLRHALAPQRS